MIHIKDHRQMDLFDPWGFLSPKRRELLDQSWAGLFQKELHTVLGALVLQQVRKKGQAKKKGTKKGTGK